MVAAAIASGDAAALKVGQPITVKFPNSNVRVRTRIDAINREQEPRTRQVTIRTSIPNVDHRLKADTLVRIEWEPAGNTPATSIPVGPTKPKLDPSLEE
jgi:hypothetical protein